jgi:hypothetical protein
VGYLKNIATSGNDEWGICLSPHDGTIFMVVSTMESRRLLLLYPDTLTGKMTPFNPSNHWSEFFRYNVMVPILTKEIENMIIYNRKFQFHSDSGDVAMFQIGGAQVRGNQTMYSVQISTRSSSVTEMNVLDDGNWSSKLIIYPAQNNTDNSHVYPSNASPRDLKQMSLTTSATVTTTPDGNVKFGVLVTIAYLLSTPMGIISVLGFFMFMMGIIMFIFLRNSPYKPESSTVQKIDKNIPPISSKKDSNTVRFDGVQQLSSLY